MQTDCAPFLRPDVLIHIALLVVVPLLTLLSVRAVFRSNGRSRILRVAAALLMLIVLAALALYTVGFETIFVFDPYIDTCFAPGYSKEAFEAVEVGMREQDVTSLLGEPLFTRPAPRDWEASPDTIWSYTGDGCSPYRDFAWYGQWIGFRQGLVVIRWCAWHFD